MKERAKDWVPEIFTNGFGIESLDNPTAGPPVKAFFQIKEPTPAQEAVETAFN